MNDRSELKNMGLKATYPRIQILEIFESSKDRHLSAEDVYRMLIAKDVDIGLATVYRVLTHFEQKGYLRRSQFDATKAVFEVNNVEHHDHLICTECGKVVEFNDTEIEKRQEKVSKEHGFDLRRHSMVLYGICKDCRGQKRH